MAPCLWKMQFGSSLNIILNSQNLAPLHHTKSPSKGPSYTGAFTRSHVQAFPVFELSCEGADSLRTQSVDCRRPSASDNEDTLTVALRVVQLNLNSCSSSRKPCHCWRPSSSCLQFNSATLNHKSLGLCELLASL